MPSAVIPVATYRLQFNHAFTFNAASAIVDYLDALGISHCYASNYLAAVPGSLHGYDMTDPTRLNAEIGDEQDYLEWIATLRRHQMGHILDLVPNHMGIAKSANPWWQEILENGPHATHAVVFDIDWNPVKPELEGKVLLPILGDSYGAVLERQEIRLEYHDGSFSARYFDHVLPIAPETYEQILGPNAELLLSAIGADSDAGAEFLSIMTAIRHLPNGPLHDADALAERHRETGVIKRRLAELTTQTPDVRNHLERVVESFNGEPNEPRSFDRLDTLLGMQAYRLAYWRVAAEEINYRRFFDINELAAIRMEDPAVFDRTHRYIFELLQRGLVDGVRIDHVDGLYDPGDYLTRVQQRAREVMSAPSTVERPLYMVVEKILGVDESLPHWPVEGTTGYDYLVRLDGLFVDSRNADALTDIYERFTRVRMTFEEAAYRGKQLVLAMSMASELNVLAHQLNRFSERSRHYRDFTLNSLVHAIREIIACFPVYRTYVNDREPAVSAQDGAYIAHAVREAKRRNPRHPSLVFDFIRDLLLKKADYIPASEHDAHMKFVGKFQQVTSPVTAKGIEDTALYMYNRLVSLNEVGGVPHRFGTSPEELHVWMQKRADRWPHGLSVASTHDTKRSEDVRARLNVLSEIPGAWKQATARWARLNRRARTIVDGQSYPSRNEEYLFYQTLIGSWPLDPMSVADLAAYRSRIVAYMLKAMREAKVFTSWLSPSDSHEHAMTRFVEMVLSPDHGGFQDDFAEFASRIAIYGIYNSLSQLAIKIGSPGVPDFYQGTEIWNFSLVDPDNRGLVDYEYRRALLNELRASVEAAGHAAAAQALLSRPTDPRLKLYATMNMLKHRREAREVFQFGTYEPILAQGTRREHLFAFRRRMQNGRQSLIVVPRLIAALLPDAAGPPLGDRVWGDTRIMVPEPIPACYRQIFTGRCVSTERESDHATLRAADVFQDFPIAVLAAG